MGYGHEKFWMGTQATNEKYLYVDAGAAITAVDRRSGELVWRTVYREGSNPRVDNILSLDGQVIIADEYLVVAFNPNDGAILWKSAVDSVSTLAEIVADDRAVYVGTADHRATAINRATGKLLWTSELAPGSPFDAFTLGLAVSGDTVYANVKQNLSESGHLCRGLVVALDRITGRHLWAHQSTGTESDAHAAPAITNRLLIISDFSGNTFFALDRFTGLEVWRVIGQPGGFGPSTSAKVRGDTAYVASNDAYVYAVDVNTGRVLWKTDTEASLRGIALCGRSVVVNHQDIAILDLASGRILASTLGGSRGVYDGVLSTRVVASGNTVFVGGMQELIAFRCD